MGKLTQFENQDRGVIILSSSIILFLDRCLTILIKAWLFMSLFISYSEVKILDLTEIKFLNDIFFLILNKYNNPT